MQYMYAVLDIAVTTVINMIGSNRARREFVYQSKPPSHNIWYSSITVIPIQLNWIGITCSLRSAVKYIPPALKLLDSVVHIYNLTASFTSFSPLSPLAYLVIDLCQL